MTTATILTDAALLQLMWLASPALPIGAFSYSEGLESAVDAGHVTNEADAANWLAEQLHLSPARSELPVTAQAIAAWRVGNMTRIAELNDWVLRTRETSEQLQQTEQMGRSMVECSSRCSPRWPHAHPSRWLIRWPGRWRCPHPLRRRAQACWPAPSAGPRT